MPFELNISQSLDERDRQILALVQTDAKLPQAEIARRVGLSTAAVHERLKKLENAGIIRRYVALVDPQAVGASVTAYIEIFIEHPRYEAEFVVRALELDEVQECHHITGEFSLLLKVRVAGMEALRELLLQQLNVMKGVRQTRTIMVLSTAKEETFVPTGLKGGSA